MKLKIVIVDLEVPPRAKRWGLRVGIPAVVLGVAAVALAGTPLHPWVQGDLLNAGDLNGNFTNLQGQITALQASVTALQAFQVQATADGGYSLGGTFCGATASTPGDLSSLSVAGGFAGRAKAKKACEAVTGCTSAAHMCTADEMLRTSALGIVVTATAGWYQTAVTAVDRYNGAGTPPYDVDEDCIGWTSTTSTSGYVPMGEVWGAGIQEATDRACSVAGPVLCCE